MAVRNTLSSSSTVTSGAPDTQNYAVTSQLSKRHKQAKKRLDVNTLPASRSEQPAEDRVVGTNAARSHGAFKFTTDLEIPATTDVVPPTITEIRPSTITDIGLPSTTDVGPPEIVELADKKAGVHTEGVSKDGRALVVVSKNSVQPPVYMEGMQYMNARIQDVLQELDDIRCQFHHADKVNEQAFLDNLNTCDRHFLRANAVLRKHSITLEVIDSETRLVVLLNQLREQEDGEDHVETTQYLTEFWQDIKNAIEHLKNVVSKFQISVLNRLKRNYINDTHGEVQIDVCSGYTDDISMYMTQIERLLSSTHILLKSFYSGIYQNLFDKCSFSDSVVVMCDVKAFPILRIVDDVVMKAVSMCDLARLWLHRDEQFMREIQNFIRQARYRSRQREEDLKWQKEKQKRYETSMKAAHILLQNNRHKLHNLEGELHVLEEQMNASARDRQWRYDQLQQKETMVDFLMITLSQTKRNYSMQTKRSRLSRQVKDLKELLVSMEHDLDFIHCEIQAKAEERLRLSEKVGHSEKSYEVLRDDMDRFSLSLAQLESEVTDLSAQLLQLEIIHNLKTSPEKVEEIYDRPSTVKLAPSLREKIKARQRKAISK